MASLIDFDIPTIAFSPGSDTDGLVTLLAKLKEVLNGPAFDIVLKERAGTIEGCRFTQSMWVGSVQFLCFEVMGEEVEITVPFYSIESLVYC